MTKRIATIGLLTTFLLGAAVAEAARKQPAQSPVAQQALSPKVGLSLRAAQEMMQKQDWDGAYAKLEEAQAITDKTPFDNFQIAEMLGYVELKRQKYPEASAAFERSIAFGLLPPAEATNRLKLVTQLALQLQDYSKAILFASRAIAATPDGEPELYGLLGQAQYLSRDYKAAAVTTGQAVAKARQAGKPLVESWLQMQLSSYGQLKDEAGVFDSLKQLAVAFPKKAYLQDLFNQWQLIKGDDRNLLNLCRLMFELNLLQNADDYLKFAQVAVDMGLPGEAIKVLERGTADKKFTDEVEQERARRQMAAAKLAVVTDRNTLAAMEQSTAAKTGEDEAQLGIALASYGQYQKAAEALQRGIAAGGIKRPDQAQLLLGQALLKLGRPAEAQAAFAAVPESAPLGAVAQLWRAYTAQPSPLGT